MHLAFFSFKDVSPLIHLEEAFQMRGDVSSKPKKSRYPQIKHFTFRRPCDWELTQTYRKSNTVRRSEGHGELYEVILQCRFHKEGQNVVFGLISTTLPSAVSYKFKEFARNCIYSKEKTIQTWRKLPLFWITMPGTAVMRNGR